jgi:hypothetical protein
MAYFMVAILCGVGQASSLPAAGGFALAATVDEPDHDGEREAARGGATTRVAPYIMPS